MEDWMAVKEQMRKVSEGAQKQKVVIGIPSGGEVNARFTESILNLQRYELTNPSDNYDLIWILFASGLYIQENRNKLVKDAKAAGADWLFQIDTDHSFDPTLLRTIMRTANKDTRPIIAGLYTNIGSTNGQSFSVLDCIYAEAKDGKYSIMRPTDTGQPFQVDAAGTGLFLTHLSVFDKIEYPWFWLSIFENPDGTHQMMNEDLSFCRLVRSQGYEIWCDPIAEASHWKNVPLLPSTMRHFLEKAGEAKKPMKEASERAERLTKIS